MNKMLVAVFETESAAFEGLSALRDLHQDGDITVYATAVLVKDTKGQTHVKQAADEGPVGTAVGLLAGSLIGLLAGPVGLAVGASLGSLTGLLYDLNKTGIDTSFLDEISTALEPGKAAVLADVEEGWTTPVDTRLEEHHALVFRRLRSEVVEDQLEREAAATDAELREMTAELEHASAETRSRMQAQMEKLRDKLQATQEQIKARLQHTETEAAKRLKTLEEQLSAASERRKAKIQERMTELKANLAQRREKLQQAEHLAREALRV